MILTSKSKRILEVALANRTAKNELVSSLGSHAVAAVVVATSTSQTTDFAALKVGDIVVRIKAGAGGALFDTVLVDGTHPSAAVVGDLYVALRSV